MLALQTCKKTDSPSISRRNACESHTAWTGHRFSPMGGGVYVRGWDVPGRRSRVCLRLMRGAMTWRCVAAPQGGATDTTKSTATGIHSISLSVEEGMVDSVGAHGPARCRLC